MGWPIRSTTCPAERHHVLERCRRERWSNGDDVKAAVPDLDIGQPPSVRYELSGLVLLGEEMILPKTAPVPTRTPDGVTERRPGSASIRRFYIALCSLLIATVPGKTIDCVDFPDVRSSRRERGRCTGSGPAFPVAVDHHGHPDTELTDYDPVRCGSIGRPGQPSINPPALLDRPHTPFKSERAVSSNPSPSTIGARLCRTSFPRERAAWRRRIAVSSPLSSGDNGVINRMLRYQNHQLTDLLGSPMTPQRSTNVACSCESGMRSPN